MAIHPVARTALVIGMGGGATAGAVSVHDGVDVDIVELAGSVVRGARFLRGHQLRRPVAAERAPSRGRWAELPDADAPTIRRRHGGRDPPHLRRLGQSVFARVLPTDTSGPNPGGLVLQWVAGTEAEYKTIARTFLSVFPETTAWVDGSLLVGSVEPLRLRRAEFECEVGSPWTRAGPPRSRHRKLRQARDDLRRGPRRASRLCRARDRS